MLQICHCIFETARYAAGWNGFANAIEGLDFVVFFDQLILRVNFSVLNAYQLPKNANENELKIQRVHYYANIV